jgi:hypothetical protein
MTAQFRAVISIESYTTSFLRFRSYARETNRHSRVSTLTLSSVSR